MKVEIKELEMGLSETNNETDFLYRQNEREKMSLSYPVMRTDRAKLERHYKKISRRNE